MDSEAYSPSKRARDDETEAQRTKREKAAERQRRKRERDRNGGVDPKTSMYPPIPAPPSNLTPDEEARKERVRAAARERQRKHRALVKHRKMQELGLDMGNEIMPPGTSHAQMAPFATMFGHPQPQELHQQLAAIGALPQDPSQTNGASQPPVTNGGQTFASTLLLSFSCAPLLKQHLLRNLNMTNDELASLEPIIADAWEQWNHQRRLHYEAAANNQIAPGQPDNEFRARFQSQLTAPTPFQPAVDPSLAKEEDAGSGEGGGA
ncbi:hypothetical protein DL96DRAFT_1626223 [Flagelloscypha sp. PMI_526]|nr:hypothetical protein DL96DRAFT_1626223 [Flagelloscypha sp. PMI_526]